MQAKRRPLHKADLPERALSWIKRNTTDRKGLAELADIKKEALSELLTGRSDSHLQSLTYDDIERIERVISKPCPQEYRGRKFIRPHVVKRKSTSGYRLRMQRSRTIALFCDKHEMHYQELADLMNMNSSTVGGWVLGKNGITSPNWEKFKEIAEAWDFEIVRDAQHKLSRHVKITPRQRVVWLNRMWGAALALALIGAAVTIVLLFT